MQPFPNELILLRNLHSIAVHDLAWFVYCIPSCLFNSIALFGWGMVHPKLLVREDTNKIVTFILKKQETKNKTNKKEKETKTNNTKNQQNKELAL